MQLARSASLAPRLPEQSALNSGVVCVCVAQVEGVEGYVLRRMAATPIAGEQSALCAVDSLYIEWHEQNTHLRLPKRARAQLAASHAWFAHRYMNASRHRGWPACRLQTYELDDETAIGDGKPWPSAWIPAWLPYWLPAWVPLPRGV